MAIITIKNLSYTDSIYGIKSVKYHHVGQKTYSAQNTGKINGHFISNIIYAPTSFKKWSEYSIDGDNTEDISIYIRASNDEIEKAKWQGPYKERQDISHILGRKIQFSLIVSEESSLIRSINVNFESNQTSVVFFTKTFNLGFAPKQIILTTNETKNEDSLLEYYISTKDSIEDGDYQLISPNKINTIDNPFLQEKAKIMVKMYGDSLTPIKLHEISALFSGNEAKSLNLAFSSSSSSAESSSSSSVDSSSSESGSTRSSSSSTSSDSIDSSSSSSEVYSSSSSSGYSSSSSSHSHSSLSSSSSYSSSSSSSSSTSSNSSNSSSSSSSRAFSSSSSSSSNAFSSSSSS